MLSYIYVYLNKYESFRLFSWCCTETVSELCVTFLRTALGRGVAFSDTGRGNVDMAAVGRTTCCSSYVRKVTTSPLQTATTTTTNTYI